MTREEEIKKQADIYTDNASNYTAWSDDGGWSVTDDIDFVEKAFIEGAKWADEHPKSPWISVKEELPCDEKDMVIEILAGIELRTKKVLVLLEDGIIGITYMYSFPPYGWHWNINDVITHWFPIPEPPKEE